MTKARISGLLFILLGSAIFVFWGSSLEKSSLGGMVDFKPIYYSSRVLVHAGDPYNPSDLLQAYRTEDDGRSTVEISQQHSQSYLFACVYPPTTLLLVTPFAILHFGPARALWMTLLSVCLIAASFLVWEVGANNAPVLSGVLIGLMLACSEVVLLQGNPSGVAVGLCVIAVWCFVRERLTWLGVLCFAASLALKPQIAYIVWLYFFVAGRIYRKRALQTLALIAALSVPALLWTARVSPNWTHEMKANISQLSVQGGINDPGPHSGIPRGIVDLQSVASVFWDEPRFYDPVSYIVCGVLLMLFIFKTVQWRHDTRLTWLALATAAPLSMLPIYHRPYDTKLLLLAIPACAMLWARRGTVGWLSLLLTTAAFALSGDIAYAAFSSLLPSMHLSVETLSGKLLTILLGRTVPLSLLAMSIFYLWIFFSSAPSENSLPVQQSETK